MDDISANPHGTPEARNHHPTKSIFKCLYVMRQPLICTKRFFPNWINLLIDFRISFKTSYEPYTKPNKYHRVILLWMSSVYTTRSNRKRHETYAPDTFSIKTYKSLHGD